MDFNNLYIIALGATLFQLSTVGALVSAARAVGMDYYSYDLGFADDGLRLRVQTILVVNRLPRVSRATGLGMGTTIIEACSIMAPTIGGILIYYFGGISVEGIRPLYYIQLIGIAS